jgi:hypothetical protein
MYPRAGSASGLPKLPPKMCRRLPSIPCTPAVSKRVNTTIALRSGSARSSILRQMCS